MKKEKEMDMSGNGNNNRRNQILKEYIKLQIENILLEDDYDIADDGQQLSGDAKFITSLLGLKGIYDIGRVAAGAAESIIKRVFGEAWVLVQRLWYTLNPYYFAMSREQINEIINQTRTNLDTELATVRNEYSDTVQQAERVLESMGTDIEAVNFMSNPSGAIGMMIGRGAYDSAANILNAILPRSFSLSSLTNSNPTSVENENPQQLAENRYQTADLRARYMAYLNSPGVQRAIENSPFVQQSRRAYQRVNNSLIQNLISITRQNIQNTTFENLRRADPSKWNETLQNNQNLFDTQEKKDAFVRYAREQIKNNAIQQIQQLIQQNPNMRGPGQQAIQQIQQMRIQ